MTGQISRFRPPAHQVVRIRACSTCEHYRFFAPHPAEVDEPITRWICVHPSFGCDSVTGEPFARDAFAARAAAGQCGPQAALYEPKARGLLPRIRRWLRGLQESSYRLLAQQPDATGPADAPDAQPCGLPSAAESTWSAPDSSDCGRPE